MPVWTIYDNFILHQFDGSGLIDLDTDTIRIMLVRNSYIPSQATHEFRRDVTDEVTGGGYSSGGMAVTGLTLSLGGGTTNWTGNDVTWPQDAGGFLNARYGILYKDTTVDSTRRLIAFLNFGGNKTNVTGLFTIAIAANGGFFNAAQG